MQAFLQITDVPFQLCTIFDVVRNQYFYLGETFIQEVMCMASGAILGSFAPCSSVSEQGRARFERELAPRVRES